VTHEKGGKYRVVGTAYQYALKLSACESHFPAQRDARKSMQAEQRHQRTKKLVSTGPQLPGERTAHALHSDIAT
jgi:hypothetical protein